jgi:hypothetical protein
MATSVRDFAAQLAEDLRSSAVRCDFNVAGTRPRVNCGQVAGMCATSCPNGHDFTGPLCPEHVRAITGAACWPCHQIGQVCRITITTEVAK